MNEQHERFEACFRRHYRDVAAYCRRRCPPEDAEDAAGEVFAVAWRRLADLPEGPDERLWLFGIARRVVANQRRAERRRDRLQLRLRAEPPPAPIAPPALEPGPVARALAALGDRDREVLLLSAWEGLGAAEIARVVGQPTPVVSTRLWRARRRFAHVYDAAGSVTRAAVTAS